MIKKTRTVNWQCTGNYTLCIFYYYRCNFYSITYKGYVFQSFRWEHAAMGIPSHFSRTKGIKYQVWGDGVLGIVLSIWKDITDTAFSSYFYEKISEKLIAGQASVWLESMIFRMRGRCVTADSPSTSQKQQ